MTETILWHDYETTGADPAWDRPVQFAAQRTDLALNPMGDPITLYCKPVADCLPHPEAVLITGITPVEAERKGVCESEFIEKIQREMAVPETCSAGYNSIRFDDEFTRHTLYRNFYDPYEREWKNGNSRWDLIDTVRLVAAVKPEILEWPRGENGCISFKLESLTQKNGLEHMNAHDALSDVQATIDLAKLIQTRQPRLFDYCWSLRHKNFVKDKIDLNTHKPFLHISSRFPAERYCSAMVMPLIPHPTNSNGVVVFDLMSDPEPLWSLDAETLSERLYLKKSESNAEHSRIGLKTVHINRSPIIVTSKVVTSDQDLARRLQIDTEVIEKNWRAILSHPEVFTTLTELFSQTFIVDEKSLSDPDLSLYQGFLSDQDKRMANRIRRSSPEDMGSHAYPFENPQLNELFFRYRARNWPETLSDSEKESWQDFRLEKLSKPWRSGALTLEGYPALLERLSNEYVKNPDKLALLRELKEWFDRFQEGVYKA